MRECLHLSAERVVGSVSSSAAACGNAKGEGEEEEKALYERHIDPIARDFRNHDSETVKPRLQTGLLPSSRGCYALGPTNIVSLALTQPAPVGGPRSHLVKLPNTCARSGACMGVDVSLSNSGPRILKSKDLQRVGVGMVHP